MEDKGKVRFIRVRGRIVPIRGDGGADLRHKRSNYKSYSQIPKKQKQQQYRDIRKIYKKHGKKESSGSHTKRVLFSAGVGGVLGGAIGVIAGAVSNRVGMLGKLGALGGAAYFGVASVQAGPQKVLSNKKFNKHYGQLLAKRYKNKGK